MTTYLQRGITWGGTKLRLTAGRTVTYRRGTQSVSITAVTIRGRRSVIGADGVAILITTYEWQVKATDLLFSGTQVEPRPGDIIVESSGGTSVKYQVLDMDDQNPCYEFLDENGAELIIRTKRMR